MFGPVVDGKLLLNWLLISTEISISISALGAGSQVISIQFRVRLIDFISHRNALKRVRYCCGLIH